MGLVGVGGMPRTPVLVGCGQPVGGLAEQRRVGHQPGDACSRASQLIFGGGDVAVDVGQPPGRVRGAIEPAGPGELLIVLTEGVGPGLLRPLRDGLGGMG